MHDGRSTSTKQQTKMYITGSSKIKHLNLSNMKSLYTYFQIIFLVLKFWITLKELIFFSAWEFLCPNIINLKKTNFQLQNIFLWVNRLWTSTWFLWPFIERWNIPIIEIMAQYIIIPENYLRKTQTTKISRHYNKWLLWKYNCFIGNQFSSISGFSFIQEI